MKNVSTQRILCDSCALSVWEVYSQRRHRMRRNRTNVCSCRLSCTLKMTLLSGEDKSTGLLSDGLMFLLKTAMVTMF